MSIVETARELSHVELGDRRLRARAERIAERIQARPDGSFPSLFDEAELEAYYRFTNNESVELHKLLEPHQRFAWGRSAGEAYVLVVHDTTQLSFPGESPREGLVFTGGRSLLHLHVSLLVGTAAAPVVHGVVGARAYVVERQLWAEVKPNAELEALTSGSNRWLDAAASARKAATNGVKLVHVMDREADDFALWEAIIKVGDDFVIRSAQANRTTTAPTHFLSAHLADQAFLFGRKVHVSRRSAQRPTQDVNRHPPRDQRFAHLEVRAGPAEIERPDRPRRKGLPKTLAVNIVEVVETQPPEGEVPISWRLLTTLPVSTGEEVERVVDFYRKRWLIEEYFKALKTGCALEERQAETRAALLNTLGLLAPVAVRLLQIRAHGRHEPDEASTMQLDEVELTCLRQAAPGTLPKRPTNREVMMAIAKLGGHLRSNGDPGWFVLGRGYSKLLMLVEGWRAAIAHLRRSSIHSGTSEM